MNPIHTNEPAAMISRGAAATDKPEATAIATGVIDQRDCAVQLRRYAAMMHDSPSAIAQRNIIAIAQRITQRGDGEVMDAYLKKVGPEMAALNVRLAQEGFPELAASMQTKLKKTERAYLERIRLYDLIESFLNNTMPKLATVAARLQKGKGSDLNSAERLATLMAQLRTADPDSIEDVLHGFVMFMDTNHVQFFAKMDSSAFIGYLDAQIGLGSKAAPAIAGGDVASGMPVFAVDLDSGHLPPAFVELINNIRASETVDGKAYGAKELEQPVGRENRSTASHAPGKLRSWHDDEGGFLPRYQKPEDKALDKTTLARRQAYEAFYKQEFRARQGYQGPLLKKHDQLLKKNHSSREKIGDKEIETNHETGYVEINADGWTQAGQSGRIIYDYRNNQYYLTATHYHPFQPIEGGGVVEAGVHGFKEEKSKDVAVTRNHVFRINVPEGSKGLKPSKPGSDGAVGGRYDLTPQQQDALAGFGLANQDVLPDGDCLFRSLIQMGATALSVQDFRNFVADYVEENADNDTIGAAAAAYQTTPAAIAGQIRTQGNYFGIAGNISPELITAALGIRLRIVNADGHATPVGQAGNVHTLIRFSGAQPHYHATTAVAG